MAKPKAAYDRAWGVVFGASLGQVVGLAPVLILAFGVFIKPVADATGWSRGEISLALTVLAGVGVLASPLVGRLSDRVGPRAVILGSATLMGLGLISLLAAPEHLIVFVLWYAGVGLLGAGQAPLTYTHVLVGWFDRRRGLALGLGLAGVGIGTALMPSVAQRLIDSFGWRGAFAGLGVLVLAVAVPAALLFLRDPPHRDRSGATVGSEGATLREALRDGRFWLIAVSFLLVGGALSGVSVHLPALLSDRGVSAQTAAAVMGGFGVSLLVGRLITGVLLDRFPAPLVTAGAVILPTLGVAMLAGGASGPQAVVAAMLAGLGVGAEVDLMAYLVSRGFGQRAFGAIYGMTFALFTLGIGAGPAMMGLAHDHTGGYGAVLWGFAAAMSVAVVLLLSLSALGGTKRPRLRPD
jgi:predicted MFS family arabinose efflux permease